MVLAEAGTGSLEVSKQLQENQHGLWRLVQACSSPQAAEALQPSEGVDLTCLNSTDVDNSL